MNIIESCVVNFLFIEKYRVKKSNSYDKIIKELINCKLVSYTFDFVIFCSVFFVHESLTREKKGCGFEEFLVLSFNECSHEDLLSLKERKEAGAILTISKREIK